MMLPYDTEICPNGGSDLCLNCGEGWGKHHGWLCDSALDKGLTSYTYSAIGPLYRYTTQAHLDAEPERKAIQDRISSRKNLDSDDYRAWQSETIDTCLCGIHRKDCDYHK